MEHCPQCQHPIGADDVFCEECGFRLQSDKASPPQGGGWRFQLPASLGSWKTLRWIIGGAILSLCTLGIICGVASTRFLGGKPEDRVVKVTVEKLVTTTPRPTATPAKTRGPTPTPTVTNTPRPTSTQTSTPTPNPTTEPSTVLEPGQTWYEDGLALRMELVAVKPEELRIDLVLDNLTDGPMLFELDRYMYRLVSNLGDTVNPRSHWSGFTYGTTELGPGERLELAKDGFFTYNLANQEVTHVFVEVVGVSRIDRARWRVEIPH